MVKKFRKAVYASRSERAKLYERVTMLCTRERKPSPAEVKTVLPQKLYREYLKRLRTFRVQKAAERRPEVIDTFIKERNELRSKARWAEAARRRAHGKRKGTNFRIEHEYSRIHERLIERFTEEPQLLDWVKFPDREEVIDALVSDSLTLSDDIRVKFHTLASFNKEANEKYYDSAEREALFDYHAVLAKEFDDSDDVSAVPSPKKFRDFSGIKF